ncbi:MAG: hypothetical protein PVG78_04495 [Desulfobacterales bacterium]|jgi:hypothetical protein
MPCGASPAPAGLLLISPAVAVTPAAALARVNLWLSKISGLERNRTDSGTLYWTFPDNYPERIISILREAKRQEAEDRRQRTEDRHALSSLAYPFDIVSRLRRLCKKFRCPISA